MLKRIFFILFAAVACFGQGVIVPPQTALKSVNGVTMPIANATITVCAASTGGLPCSPALANALFKDAALTQPLSNPFTADANGNYNFAIAPGNYTVTVTASGFSGYSYQVSSGNGTAGSSVTLQTNGVNNSLQTLLNIAQGTGVQAANSGGQITISNTGVVSYNGRAGAVVATLSDVTGVFTGTCNNTTFLRGDGQCVAAGGVSSVFGRSGAVTAQANDYTWNLIGAGSNLNAQTMGTGGSMAPLNIGQVAGSQAWLAAGLSALTTITANPNAGTIPANHSYPSQYTLISAAGETLPSAQTAGGSGVSCGTGCSITFTAPTIPTGYTGWTLYTCDTTAGPCTVPQKVGACTALAPGANCTITATFGTNTSGVPTTNTAWTQPANVQAGSVPYGSIPSFFFPKTDGNNYPWLTVNWVDCDNTNGPPCPAGTPLFTARTYWSDIGAPSAAYPSQTQSFKNSFVSINHGAGNGTVATNQDRALGILAQTPAGDATARYSLYGLQVETDWNGTATFSGHPDSGISGISVQVADSHTDTNNVTAGESAVGGTVFLEAGSGTINSCASAPCISGVSGAVADDNTSGGGSNAVAGGVFFAFNNVGSQTSRQGFGVYIKAPSSTSRFGTSNYGLYIPPWLSSTTNRNDRQFMFDGNGTVPTKGVIQSALWLGGQQVSGQAAILNNFYNNAATTTSIPVTGSLQLTGALSTAQLSTPPSPACSVTGGTGTTYQYTVVAVDGNGNTTASPSTCTASAAATLNGSNFVTISNSPGPHPEIARYDVYRPVASGTPNTLGFIGSMTSSGNTDIESQASNAQYSLVDNGLAGNGATAPAANTTGGLKVAGDVTFSVGKGQHFNTQAANNDYAGTCTLASATPSTCTVTFTRAYTAAPVCVATNQTTQANPIKAAPTTSNVVFTGPNTVTDVVAYICVGNPN